MSHEEGIQYKLHGLRLITMNEPTVHSDYKPLLINIIILLSSV